MKVPPPLKFFVRRRTLFIFGFLLLWLVILELVWLVPALQRIRTSASELSVQVAQNARSNVNASLEEALSELRNAAADIQLEPTRTQIVIQRFTERNPTFLNAAVVDRNGIVIAKTGIFNATSSPDYSKLSNLYLAFAGTPSFGTVFAADDGTLHIFATTPIADKNGIVRALVVEVNLEHLVTTLRSFQDTPWRIYITDKSGMEIMRGNVSSGMPHQSLLVRPIVQKVVVDGQAANGLAADDAYTLPSGEKVFAVGEPIPLTSWGIFIERPEREAFGEQGAVIALAVVIFILGLLAIGVGLWSYFRLSYLNERLNMLLGENYQSAKLLVARDLELNEKNTRLQELDAMKSDFVSVAAHQLRTPMTGVRWSFHALLDGSMGQLTSEQEWIAREGLKVTINAVDLINDLLDVARVEEGRFGYRMQKHDLRPVIEQALKEVEAIAKGKDVVLTSQIEDALPEMTFDKEKILIMLNNLLMNAIKYTPPRGEATLTVRKDPRGIVCTVTDTGIGIPKGEIGKVFTKFFRAGNAMLFQTSGTGLGLYMVKSIVERHGGVISIESEENKGTTVTFTLPIV